MFFSFFHSNHCFANSMFLLLGCMQKLAIDGRFA